MEFLEKDLETMIWEAYHSNVELLRERGLYMFGEAFRQVNLGTYGIADIVTAWIEIHPKHKYRKLYIEVYELKKDQVNIDTLLQAIGYCKGIERMLKKDILPHLRIDDVEFNISLIGKTIEKKSEFCFMADFFKNLSIYTYSADLKKGFTFIRNQEYSMTNEMRGCITKSDQKKVFKMVRLAVSQNNQVHFV